MQARRLSHALELTSLIQLTRDVNSVLGSLGTVPQDFKFDVSGILPLDTSFFVTAANLEKELEAAGVKDVKFLVPDLSPLRLDELHHEFEKISLQNFKSADPEIINGIVDVYLDKLPNIPAKIERFEQTLAELMENVYVHSQCKWGGFIYGYYNKTDNKLQFSIADFGTGIPWTLAQVAPYNAGFDDDTLTYEASKYSVTSKRGRAGSGLDYAATFAKDLGGVMRVFSRRGCLRIDSEAKCLSEADTEYPGTLVTIELPLR